jgi:hypothetical protein
MFGVKKILVAGASVAAITAAAPAAAQYYSQPYGQTYGQVYAQPYGQAYAQPYGRAYASPYGAPYGNAYGYNNASTQAAAQRCSAAVQQRLSTRTGVAGILGAVLGARTVGGRVVQVTQVNPNRSGIRVRGLASSGSNMGPYGAGAYGAYGMAYQPDLSFKCDVDYRGYVRDIDINRR